MIHRRTHATPVPGCAPCRWAGVMVSPSATPSRTESRPGERAYMDRTFAEFSNGDREAYRRLRQDGLQPPHIAGSAHLEAHASTRFEVESGRVYDDQRSLRAALGICADHGYDPHAPATAPKDL